MHAVAPVLPLNDPAAHSVADVDPGDPTYEPAGASAQDVHPGLELNEPAAQSVADAEPGDPTYVPAGARRHALELVAPGFGLYLPAGQFVAKGDPVVST